MLILPRFWNPSPVFWISSSRLVIWTSQRPSNQVRNFKKSFASKLIIKISLWGWKSPVKKILPVTFSDVTMLTLKWPQKEDLAFINTNDSAYDDNNELRPSLASLSHLMTAVIVVAKVCILQVKSRPVSGCPRTCRCNTSADIRTSYFIASRNKSLELLVSLSGAVIWLSYP